jgi:hypothetical protein
VVDVGAAPGSPLLINEVQAENRAGDVDEAGEFEDWVELINTSSTAINLSGFYLSDEIGSRRKWAFPSNATVPAGGFLRIWCDDEPGEGPLHASFKLSADGEWIGLFGPDANGNPLIDGFAFGEQRADLSFGRVPDGWTRTGPYYLWTPSGNAPTFGPGRDSQRYDSRRNGSSVDFDLKFSGSGAVGSIASLDFEGGTPFGSVFAMMSINPSELLIPGVGPLLIEPTTYAWFLLGLDASGNASLPIPVFPFLAGIRLYFQGISQDMSNGLAVQFR